MQEVWHRRACPERRLLCLHPSQSLPRARLWTQKPWLLLFSFFKSCNMYPLFFYNHNFLFVIKSWIQRTLNKKFLIFLYLDKVSLYRSGWPWVFSSAATPPKHWDCRSDTIPNLDHHPVLALVLVFLYSRMFCQRPWLLCPVIDHNVGDINCQCV